MYIIASSYGVIVGTTNHISKYWKVFILRHCVRFQAIRTSCEVTEQGHAAALNPLQQVLPLPLTGCRVYLLSDV
jgi:hypothetical protein